MGTPQKKSWKTKTKVDRRDHNINLELCKENDNRYRLTAFECNGEDIINKIKTHAHNRPPNTCHIKHLLQPPCT